MYSRQHTKPSAPASLGVTSHIDTLATSTFTAKKLITGKFSEPEIVTLDDRYPDGVVYITWQAGPSTDGKVFRDMPGLKTYEYTNHLGNVLMTTSDKKIPQWENKISDSFSGPGLPNYGWDETTVGVTLDASSNQYLGIGTSQQYGGAYKAFDTEPGRHYLVTIDISVGSAGNVGYGVYDYTGTNLIYGIATTDGQISFIVTAISHSTHLLVMSENTTGNPVGFRLNDAQVDEIAYGADVASTVDYYPYGMSMVGRNFNQSDYRFGYQGSEMDNEHKGNGNAYTTYFRQLDPRLGRWMSVDPVTQPWQSPYVSMDDNPIVYNDPLGNWVKGAGFFKNVFNSDAKINAKAKAKATGGVAFKDGDKGGWTVNYTTEESIDLGNGAEKVKVFNVEHYKGKSFGKGVADALSAADGLMIRAQGNSYGEGEDWIKSMKMGGEVKASVGNYEFSAEAGIYSTGEDYAGTYVQFKASGKVDGGTNETSIKNEGNISANAFIEANTGNPFMKKEAGSYDVNAYVSGNANMGMFSISNTTSQSLSNPNKAPSNSTRLKYGVSTGKSSILAGVKGTSTYTFRTPQIHLKGNN